MSDSKLLAAPDKDSIGANTISALTRWRPIPWPNVWAGYPPWHLWSNTPGKHADVAISLNTLPLAAAVICHPGAVRQLIFDVPSRVVEVEW